MRYNYTGILLLFACVLALSTSGECQLLCDVMWCAATRRCTAAMSVVCIQTQGCVMSHPVSPSAGTLCSYLPDATVCLSCSLCESDRSRRQADALACTAHVRRVQVVWITQSCELHSRCGQCTSMTTHNVCWRVVQIAPTDRGCGTRLSYCYCRRQTIAGRANML